MRRASFLLSLTLLSLIIPGCGDGYHVKVYGKILKSGAKYQLPAGHQLLVTFVAFDAQDVSGKPIKGEPFQALLDPDGESFSVLGPEGTGIPPGKYRVAITERMTREAFEASKATPDPRMGEITRETDFFSDRLGPDKSPIFRDVNGSGEIIIDLDKPESL